jgi:hypothetical protein
MSLNKAIENLKFDKRLVELNLKLGRVTQQELDQKSKELPDLEAQSEKLNLEKEEKDLN